MKKYAVVRVSSMGSEMQDVMNNWAQYGWRVVSVVHIPDAMVNYSIKITFETDVPNNNQ